MKSSFVDALFLLLCALALVDVSQLIFLVVGPYLWQQTERFVLLCFLQIGFERGCNLRASSLGIVGHLVESLAVVVVLHLSEGLHSSVEIVGYDGVSVSVVIEGFPARVRQVLCIVGEVHASLQHILASHRRKGVEVESDDEVGIIGKESCELVVEILLVEVQLVELCKVEREVLVHIIIYSSGVGGIVYGSVGLYQRFAREEVLVFGVFCHRDVEVAVDALVFLKLQMGPLPVVDKLLECLLQVVEYGIVRALYLSMVDGDFGLQFLCLEAVTTACQPARQ